MCEAAQEGRTAFTELYVEQRLGGFYNEAQKLKNQELKKDISKYYKRHHLLISCKICEIHIS